MFQPVQTVNRSLEGRIVDHIRDLVERGELSVANACRRSANWPFS